MKSILTSCSLMLFKDVFFHFSLNNNIPLNMLILGAFLIFGLPVLKIPFLTFFFFLNKFIYLFIYFWLCWVFVSVWGLSLVAASGGHSLSRCAGLSLSPPLLLWSTGSRRAGSVVVAHRPSCSAACGIFPDQGLNPCPLHWQADSQLLRHQERPPFLTFELQKYIALCDLEGTVYCPLKYVKE